MANVCIPVEVLNPIMQRAFKEADKIGYLNCSKPESGKFMEQLEAIPEIGGVLKEYMPKERVIRYIKDAILHDYTDKKKEEAQPPVKDVLEWCRKEFEIPTLQEIEHIKRPYHEVMLFRSTQANTYVVVADGSVMQWETALKKALVYLVDKPFTGQIGTMVRVVLSLYGRFKPVPKGEQVELKKALSLIGGTFRLYAAR